MTDEFRRVQALPRRVLLSTTYPDATDVFALDPPTCQDPNCPIKRLTWIQSAILVEASIRGGLFGNVGVGRGKTLATLLLPDALRSTKAVLLVPPQLKAQLLEHEIFHYAQHFRLPTVLDADGTVHYQGPADGPSLTVVAYSELSSTTRRGALEKAAPDLVIADEAHCLRHRDAARTRRFLRYMRRNPATRFVALSGTMTEGSVRDYAHLTDLALRTYSPLPRGYVDLQAWADALDVGGEGGPGALVHFCQPHESTREGYQRRLIETPGVVATTGIDDLAASLEIRARLPRVPKVIAQALATVQSTWEWDGIPYTQAADVWRLQRQLTCGFYYRQVWPGGSPDLEWNEARLAWDRAVRKRLTYTNREGQDSPALLEELAETGAWSPPEWAAWLAVRDRPPPVNETVWLSDYLVKDAAKWAKEAKEGIIWVADPPVGAAIAHALGTDYFGEDSDAELARATPTSHAILVAGIASHGQGKNLQAWCRNLVVSPPGGGSRWEQLVGRTHRLGQRADTVSVDVNLHTDVNRGAWLHAREKALYAHATLGQPQKIIYGKWVER